MALPNDDFILLSLVNTRLRDGEELGDFCAAYETDEEELLRRLSAAGYRYDGDARAFKRF